MMDEKDMQNISKVLKKDSVRRMRAIRFFIEPVFPGPLGAIQVLIDTGESIKKGSSNKKFHEFSVFSRNDEQFLLVT